MKKEQGSNSKSLHTRKNAGMRKVKLNPRYASVDITKVPEKTIGCGLQFVLTNLKFHEADQPKNQLQLKKRNKK